MDLLPCIESLFAAEHPNLADRIAAARATRSLSGAGAVAYKPTGPSLETFARARAALRH